MYSDGIVTTPVFGSSKFKQPIHRHGGVRSSPAFDIALLRGSFLQASILSAQSILSACISMGVLCVIVTFATFILFLSFCAEAPKPDPTEPELAVPNRAYALPRLAVANSSST
jgi:hypothetical protein